MTPRQVLRTYLAVVGLFNLSASLIWGVNTLFLLEAGLSLTQTFIANAFYTLGMVIFEIPTGVVADTLGRRTSFLASLVILCIGTLAYVLLASLPVSMLLWAVASIFLGLGFTFYSGAVEAWVVDAMAAAGHQGPMDTVFARGGQVQGATMLLGTLGGGFLATIDLAWPYLVRAILLVLCFLVAWRAMHDLGFDARPFRVRQVPREMRRVLGDSLDDGWRRPAVRLLLLISMIHWGFLIWGWYAWQPHFVALADGKIWIAGAVAAAVSVTMILGNGFGPRIAAWIGDRSWHLAIAQVFFIAGLAGVAIADSFWPAVLSFLGAMMAFGIHEPVRTAMLHALIPSRTRATVISFGGLMASAAGVVSQIVLADYAETAGIPAGYAVGAVLMIFAVPLAIMGGRIAGDACKPTGEGAESAP
ncbi:MAG: MFS transporter [Thermoplasmatota archaeon]